MIRHYSRASTHKRLEYDTAVLWENMVSPLCGILTNLYIYHRQTYDPKGIAIGGELTNVGPFKGINASINYHIGGMGMTREDAMLKCLAEAYERYTPVLFDPEKFRTNYFGSYMELSEKFATDLILPQNFFQYFSEEQYNQKKFFRRFDDKAPMLWVQVPDIISGRQIWLPAHLLFFGYLPKTTLGEYRINSAVSTGTAVHRSLAPCVLNSLFEIILIDAAICHWYTDHKAYKIELSARTRHIQKIVKKSIPHENIAVEFYWIPSVDFPTFNIACIAKSDTIPKLSVGLGSDLTLEGAMYKAFMEYFGVRFLSHTLAVLQDKVIDSSNIQNLDDNVLFYSLGNGDKRVCTKFNSKNCIKDSELPPDLSGSKTEIVNLLLNKFSETEKNIAFINFSNSESEQLDLVATKLWSPQLITVPIPSAVPVMHQRFQDYGGVRHLEPHPYA